VNENRLEGLKNLKKTDQEKFYHQPFFISILVYLGKKLPLQDETILANDFIQLKGEQAILKKQLQSFNNNYKIISNEDLNNEFTNLVANGITKYCYGNQNNPRNVG